MEDHTPFSVINVHGFLPFKVVTYSYSRTLGGNLSCTCTLELPTWQGVKKLPPTQMAIVMSKCYLVQILTYSLNLFLM